MQMDFCHFRTQVLLPATLSTDQYHSIMARKNRPSAVSLSHAIVSEQIIYPNFFSIARQFGKLSPEACITFCRACADTILCISFLIPANVRRCFIIRRVSFFSVGVKIICQLVFLSSKKFVDSPVLLASCRTSVHNSNNFCV